jgi:hypothetical protein
MVALVHVVMHAPNHPVAVADTATVRSPRPAGAILSWCRQPADAHRHAFAQQLVLLVPARRPTSWARHHPGRGDVLALAELLTGQVDVHAGLSGDQPARARSSGEPVSAAQLARRAASMALNVHGTTTTSMRWATDILVCRGPLVTVGDSRFGWRGGFGQTG